MENVKDIDGNSYKTVKIGNQIWMAENLKVEHYRNGNRIPELMDDDWDKTTKGAYCNYRIMGDDNWGNDENNVKTYGRIYNGYAVDDKRGLAPNGWHIPTDDEIKELEMYLGMSKKGADSIDARGTNVGSKLADSTDLWTSVYPANNLVNDTEFGTSGFNFLPGGYRTDWGYCDGIGRYGCFWSSTGTNIHDYHYRELIYDDSGIYRHLGFNKKTGLSVRCIKD
jgi:uncharacterized protein (TIGR02145 family)